MNKLKIIILAVFATLALTNGKAQQVFYSQLLQNLYWSLPNACLVSDTTKMNRVVLCRNVVQNETVPLIFSWDKNHVLDHIGYRFLPGTATTDNVIIRFIERELLTMFLSDDIDQTLITHKENGLTILLNNTPVKHNVLQDKRVLLNLLKTYHNIVVNYDGKNYDVRLLFANEQELSFRFRADSELITGMDKKEREIRLAIQLKNHRAATNSLTNKSDATPDHSYLQLVHDTIYVDKGDSFMIPQINNDLVYIKADSVYNLAFDKSLIAESFSNVLLMPVRNNYKINITHRMYGKVIREYTVESVDFDDYFSRDYDRYFGVESLEKEKLTGTLILSDRNANSIHLAYVSISLDDLLNGGTMKMQLYSNIPQQNVKTLLDK
ncbi:MAG: hypothetical protein LBK45_05830 [Tannerellaceae bacterium]|nr:hypothetical protein [Tannerellaceae bacterium]